MQLSLRDRFTVRCLFYLLAAWTLWQVPHIATIRFTDFDYYYSASARLHTGENIYFDANAAISRPEIPSWYLYPPYLAGLIYPLTILDPLPAKAVYAVIAVLMLIAIDILLVKLQRRLYPKAGMVEILIHIVVFLPYPTHLLLYSLQIEGVLLVLFLLAVLGSVRRKNRWIIGIAFSSSVLIKLWPAPYVLSLLAVWREKMILPIMMTSLLIVVVLTPIVGVESQYYFYCYVMLPLISYADFYIDNQSLLACIRRLAPAFESGYPFFRMTLLLMYLYSTYRSRNALAERHPKAIAVNASLFVAISLLVSATTWTAAHVRLLLPLTVSACISAEQNKNNPLLALVTFVSFALYCYPQSWGAEFIPFLFVRDYPLLIVCFLQCGVMYYFSRKYFNECG
ncbi:MAG: DUF2029 domain-containing protein [Candidatus Omnitrophota bacterium]|jgi:hypothetical protein|nr:MAG: DUF2029 domain-containing protein [Candidatus Omnitrophota bacterium]